MPRGNQRGYKGMSGYKGGAKIFDSFVKAGLTAAFGKPKRKATRKYTSSPSSTQLGNSGCLICLLVLIIITTSIKFIL